MTINHKVISKDFEALFPSIDIDFPPGSNHGYPNNLSDFGLEFKVVLLRHIVLHVTQVHLVAGLLIVLSRMFLDRVVRQMDERVVVVLG